jgi:hypothetical protein
MTSYTADEAKAERVRAMGAELGVLYDALWQQVAWLYVKWSEYVVLFGTKESRVKLLNSAAPTFTRIVQDSLWEDVILHIARLTDPPKSAGRPNLSLQRLADAIGHEQTKATVFELMFAALSASEFCRDWRNRHIAHRDLELALEGGEPLKPVSRKKVREALDTLVAVLNAVSSHYLDTTTIFSEVGPQSGGAQSLLYVLDCGVNAETARRERLRAGSPDPSDLVPREL